MTASQQQGVIVKGVGGLYYIRDSVGEVHILRAKGVFRIKHITPLVGDTILFTPHLGDEHGWIEQVLPRRNELIRPPVANILHLVFVMAPEPEPDFMLLDTMLVMARQQGIAPVIVVNKCEMDASLAVRLRAEYVYAEVPILEVSALERIGLDALGAVLSEGISCFAGQSGVGKSSILNAVTGLTLQSGEISRKIARGKNTTRHAELLIHNGYQVLDTAGFSLLEFLEHMDPVELKSFYPEFSQYEDQCHFQPCYHYSEPGCAVLAAVKQGELPEARIERYHALLQKVKESWRNRYV